MPGVHFSLRMSEPELETRVTEELAALVEHLVPEVFAFVPVPEDEPPGAERTPERARALAHLHLLTHIQQAALRLEAGTAYEAARAGAGYPQIGRASGLTRQGARRRWPGLSTPTADPDPSTGDPDDDRP
ncbi:hypothetical protein [Streptomyces sp. NPDC047046]|uniref:hypothetical protein n=1 Tax=Streptomyces sp. NPDC047046 TaxID=3155378 RepID=UPI003401B532